MTLPTPGMGYTLKRRIASMEPKQGYGRQRRTPSRTAAVGHMLYRQPWVNMGTGRRVGATGRRHDFTSGGGERCQRQQLRRGGRIRHVTKSVIAINKRQRSAGHGCSAGGTTNAHLYAKARRQAPSAFA